MADIHLQCYTQRSPEGELFVKLWCAPWLTVGYRKSDVLTVADLVVLDRKDATCRTCLRAKKLNTFIPADGTNPSHIMRSPIYTDKK